MSGEPRRLKLLAGHLTPTREWLTMAELAEHGRFPSPEAARLFVRRHRDLPHGKRGRHLIVDRATFDRYVLERGLTKRSA